MAEAEETSDAAQVDSYIGSLICLITKSEIRYEGFMFHLDAKESIIGLRNVKSFGTEGRRKDGPQVSPTEKLYEYIYFRGSDIKDLQVLSAPSAQSTSAVPDDPAIIQRHPHLPPEAFRVLPTAFQVTDCSSNAQSGTQAPSFSGNLPVDQFVEVTSSCFSVAPPPPPVKVNQPTLPNYWPGLSGGTDSSQQRSFPPPPQGLSLADPIQQPMKHLGMNASLATEAPRLLLPPICTGSFTLISTVPPSSSVQSSNILLNTLFSSFPTALVNSSSQMMSSSVTSSNVNPVVPPVTQTGQSLLGPAPYPIVSKSVSSTTGTSGESHGKTSIASQARQHKNLQPALLWSSSTFYSKDGDDDAKIVVRSSSDPQQIDTENLKEAAQQQSKKVTTKRHQRNRGHTQGRGRNNLPNRNAMYRQSHRGHSFGRGNEITGGPLHPTVGQGQGNAPNIIRYPRHYIGSHACEAGGQVSSSVTRFTEDFDFEAMNQKFNKEEVWGLLGKSKQAEAQDKEADEKHGDTSGAQDEAGHELPKLDEPVYFKDEFFDSISCRSLDADSGRGRMKQSEQRRIDAETFGEMPKHRQGRGIPGPQRGWSFQGSYRGKGSGNAGRGGRGATPRNRMRT